MPDFTVDIDGMDALGKNLGRAVDNIDQAIKKMQDIGPDSIGPEDLDEACADFKEDWEGGLRELRRAVDEMKGGLNQAMKGYAELEAGLTDSLKQMAGDMGSGQANG